MRIKEGFELREICGRSFYKNPNAYLSNYPANTFYNIGRRSFRRKKRSCKRWNLCSFRTCGSSDLYGRRRIPLCASAYFWFSFGIYYRRICYRNNMPQRKTDLKTADHRLSDRNAANFSARNSLQLRYNMSVHEFGSKRHNCSLSLPYAVPRRCRTVHIYCNIRKTAYACFGKDER